MRLNNSSYHKYMHTFITFKQVTPQKNSHYELQEDQTKSCLWQFASRIVILVSKLHIFKEWFNFFVLFFFQSRFFEISRLYSHSSWSLAVTVSTVCWMSSFSSTSASYNALSKNGGLSFLSAIPIRMNLVTAITTKNNKVNNYHGEINYNIS